MTARLLPAIFAALLLPTSAAIADDLILAGVSGVKLVDAGQFLVSGKAPSARVESFEFLQRPDGGYTLLSATTIADGTARVQARYDYDEDWNALRALGQGIYEGEPVRVILEAQEALVSIRAQGETTDIEASVPCPNRCFMDMAPSGSPMFVMMQHYDHEKGGVQSFRWAAQDLMSTFSSPVNQRAELRLRREIPIERADGSTMTIRDFEMIERIPLPTGGDFVMEFDLWTDRESRPMGYRINRTGGRPSTSGIIGFRAGYDDVRARLLQVTASSPDG